VGIQRESRLFGPPTQFRHPSPGIIYREAGVPYVLCDRLLDYLIHTQRSNAPPQTTSDQWVGMAMSKRPAHCSRTNPTLPPLHHHMALPMAGKPICEPHSSELQRSPTSFLSLLAPSFCQRSICTPSPPPSHSLLSLLTAVLLNLLLLSASPPAPPRVLNMTSTGLDEKSASSHKELDDVYLGNGKDIANARTISKREPPPYVRALSPEERVHAEAAPVRKIDFRLVPPIIVMYIMNYLDRNNIAAARLAVWNPISSSKAPSIRRPSRFSSLATC
jgi:hypothetical protein